MASELEYQWIDYVISGIDPKQAVKMVYPDYGKTSQNYEKQLSTRVSQLKSKLSLEFAQRLQERIIYDSPDILMNMKDLALNANSESVKMSASKDLLDRAAIGTDKSSIEAGISVTINRDHVTLQGQNNKLYIKLSSSPETPQNGHIIEGEVSNNDVSAD